MAKQKPEAPAKPSKAQDKALAQRPNKALATKTHTKVGGKGFENLSREDILLPRILLLQPMSPQVMEMDEKPGTLFLNLSNKSIGDKVMITPVLHYRSRIKWVPKDDGGGIDCSAQDAKTPSTNKYAENCAACKYKDWDDTKKDKKEQAPECTMYDNFVVLVNDGNEPVILSMAKSQAKVAKKFYSMMVIKGGDMFDYTYSLTVVKEKKDDKTFFNFSVADTGKKTTDERRIQCEQLWASLSKATVRAEMEPDTAAAPEAEGDGEKKF
jgi:hypothetical protein